MPDCAVDECPGSRWRIQPAAGRAGPTTSPIPPSVPSRPGGSSARTAPSSRRRSGRCVADAGGGEAEQEAVERQVMERAPRERGPLVRIRAAVAAAVEVLEVQRVQDPAPSAAGSTNSCIGSPVSRQKRTKPIVSASSTKSATRPNVPRHHAVRQHRVERSPLGMRREHHVARLVVEGGERETARARRRWRATPRRRSARTGAPGTPATRTAGRSRRAPGRSTRGTFDVELVRRRVLAGVVGRRRSCGRGWRGRAGRASANASRRSIAGNTAQKPSQ